MTKFFDNIDSKNKYKLLRSFKADTYNFKTISLDRLLEFLEEE